MKRLSAFFVVLTLVPGLAKNNGVSTYGIATKGQFPSSAIIYNYSTRGTHFCGGTLINEFYVITTAICVQDALRFNVSLGTSALISADTVTVFAVHYMVHPDFDPQTLDYNIGIIQLFDPVNYTEYIRAAYLATVKLPDDFSGVGVSWGSFSDGSGISLNYANVSTISKEECKMRYGKLLSDSMVCVVSNDDEAFCKGSTGSPLLSVLSNEHQWIMGIASFSATIGTCTSYNPLIYARLFPALDWVKEVAGIE
ncbi:chymotrypsin BI-like isoform X1 [Zophobas morio]|uniref:chymotrypsin BI-like isoform X1 n=1 Tax=Zophobas morio TaxID=2755281 RepID=UPI0030829716